MTETPAIVRRTIEADASGLVLGTFDEWWRMANLTVKSGLAPAALNTPEKMVVAWQWGAELGLSRMQAMQSITVINGRPSLWGDALPALVWGSGKCAYLDEHIEGEGEKAVAVCETKRKDSERPVIRTYSVEDARQAGLWGKAGPWKNYPTRMLQMRARAFCLRDAYADVLRGLAVVEDIQDAPVRAAVVETESDYKLPTD